MPRSFGQPGALGRSMMTIDEVATALGHDRFWFLRNDNRQRLRALGFPEAVPGLGRVWDPEAIDDWLDRFLPESARAARRVVQAVNDNAGDRQLLAARDRLRKRILEADASAAAVAGAEGVSA